MIFLNRRLFNFDAALRYYPVVKILEKTDNPAVLEVGSGTNGISDFFEGEIIGLDSNFAKTDTTKNKNIKHIKGSITRIPLKDNNFDFVICLDTFEHITKSQRTKAIEEMLRVTKKGGQVIVGFPSSVDSEKMETKINKLYKEKNGKDHVWLAEHRQNGLPDRKEILDILEKLGINKENIIILGNVNLTVWFIVHWLYTINDGSFLSKLLKRFYKIFFSILTRINIAPYYRLIFVINK